LEQPIVRRAARIDVETTHFIISAPANNRAAVPGEGPVTNIPTELLRTLIAVVDLRSFTKAAQSLGVTQPAVSAQIKRLQGLLATDLLDKSAPGVSLTSAGELVVNYARRLLSINDQILDIATPRHASKTVRIGASGDFAAAGIALGLTCSRARRPDLRFEIYNANIDVLLRDLREGEADLAVWVSAIGPVLDTRHYWTEPLVWVRGPTTRLDAARPVPLVSYGEECLFTRNAMTVLREAGRDSELSFVGSSLLGLAAAVAAGFGVMALPRSRADIPGIKIWDDAPLPKLPDIFCGVYVRTGAEPEDRELIADAVAAALRPHSNAEPADTPRTMAHPAA
jgi:DNA-binding transcriptional LysR family regulator